MKYNRGFSNILIIIFGLILCVLAVGYFSSYSSMKIVENPQCGIVINAPSISTRIDKKTHIEGYVNGCGWNPKSGKIGKVTLYRYDGIPVTSSQDIAASNPSSTKSPYYFDMPFPYNGNGATPGYLRFESNSFSKYSLPVVY